MFDFSSLNLGRPVDTIVDVGAGLGTFLSPARDFYQPNQTLAIEMLPDRAARLWLLSDRVINAAAGEFRGWKQIGRTLSADSSSLLTIDPKAQDWFTTGPHGMDQTFVGEVEVRTLDDMCSYLTQIDLMKIDIQGYEGHAIRGGQATLRRTHALIIEVLFCHHYEGQSTAEEIHELLLDLGFHLEKVLEDNWNGGVHLQGDRLYVNTRF
jgi:FkbM family methyltransferase